MLGNMHLILVFNVMFSADDFQITIAGQILDISVRNAHERVLFIVTFPDKRPGLVLTRLVNLNDKKVWTSIPQGRMEEAQLIGPEIVKHFKNLK